MRLPTTLNNWAGATGFVVATFLSLGWAVSMVAAALDDDVSEAGIQLLSSLGGVLAGAVAGYLGAGAALLWTRRHDRNGRRTMSDDQPDVDPDVDVHQDDDADRSDAEAVAEDER